MVSISFPRLFLVVAMYDLEVLTYRCMCIEKETYDLFDAADGAYDELEDDFVFIANEGMPLLVPQEDDKQDDDAGDEDTKYGKGKKGKKVTFGFSKTNNDDDDDEMMDADEADYRARDDVIVIGNEETDEEKRLREYRERVLAMVAPEGTNFKGVFDGQ